MNVSRNIAVAVALLVSAGQAAAKITFNDVRKSCWPDIREFLGSTPWAGHAYRVDTFAARDGGRSLIAMVPASISKDELAVGDVTYVTYRHVELRVHIGRLNQTHGVSFSYEADAFLVLASPHLQEKRDRFQHLLAFQSWQAPDAPIWYVFRASGEDEGDADTMLFTVDAYGRCAEAPYYPFRMRGSPLVLVRQ